MCRHCYALPYGSQQETAQDRLYRKVRKIRDRLGASHNLMESLWPWNKPKGMHWSTYDRLADRYNAYDNIWALGAMRLLGIRVR